MSPAAVAVPEVIHSQMADGIIAHHPLKKQTAAENAVGFLQSDPQNDGIIELLTGNILRQGKTGTVFQFRSRC